MREIKFRAWNPEHKKMYYDFDQNIKEVKLGHSIHQYVYETGLLFGTLMQYTGLKDKNSVDIYEGDVVNYDGTPYNVYALKAAGVIVMHKYSWKLKYKSQWHKSYDHYSLGCEDFFHKKSEVLGNIHQNPELLK